MAPSSVLSQTLKPRRAVVKFEESIEKFLARLEAQGRSPLTLRHYRRHLRAYARWLESSEPSEKLATGDDRASLDLDLSEVRVKISFARSSSPAFKEAVLLARELPGYHCEGSGSGQSHSVDVELNRHDPEL